MIRETQKQNWNKLIVNEIVCFCVNNNSYYFLGRAKEGRNIEKKRGAQHHNQLNYKMRHITFQLKIKCIFMISFHSIFLCFFSLSLLPSLSVFLSISLLFLFWFVVTEMTELNNIRNNKYIQKKKKPHSARAHMESTTR